MCFSFDGAIDRGTASTNTNDDAGYSGSCSCSTCTYDGDTCNWSNANDNRGSGASAFDIAVNCGAGSVIDSAIEVLAFEGGCGAGDGIGHVREGLDKGGAAPSCTRTISADTKPQGERVERQAGR